MSFHDGISVTRQSDQMFSFTVEACRGEVGVRVEDENSDPVSGALLELYALNRTWDQDFTGANGVLTFTQACGMEVGVRVTPPAGYTVPEGRGSSFYDGLRPDIGGRVEAIHVGELRLDEFVVAGIAGGESLETDSVGTGHPVVDVGWVGDLEPALSDLRIAGLSGHMGLYRVVARH